MLAVGFIVPYTGVPIHEISRERVLSGSLAQQLSAPRESVINSDEHKWAEEKEQ